MKKTLIVSSIVLATLGGAFAYAQAPGQGMGMGMGRQGGQAAQSHPQFEMNREDRQAMLDGRIAGAKAMLKLNAEQEKLWGPVEASLRDMGAQRMAMREQRREERKAGQDGTAKTDPVVRMKEQATRMQQHAAAMGKLADASAPLYASLDEAQKRRFSMLLRQGGGYGERMGRHHGMMGGRGMDGERGRDGGPDGNRPGPGGRL